jgi:prolyl-tRNA synthetase
MPDGKTLQIGTAHHLGDHFSRTFQIQFEDVNGEQRFAQQTCYGISERSIASLISIHGDDRGLVLPPLVAPVQVIVIPVIVGKKKEEILSQSTKLVGELSRLGYRVQMDQRDLRPGAKYYYWEMRGVPLRLEIGPRDLQNNVVTAVTRDGERSTLPRESLAEKVQEVLTRFEGRLREKARVRLEQGITRIHSSTEITSAMERGVALVPWCGEIKCAEELAGLSGGSMLGFITDTGRVEKGDERCLICGNSAATALLGRAY